MRLLRPSAAALATALLVPAASAARTDPVESSIAWRVGVIRAHRGLPSVHVTRPLTRVADRHSRAMARFGVLTHGRGVGTRVRGRVVGETLAWIPQRDRRLAATVVRAWMHSPGHRAVLLDPRLRKIGVARRLGAGGWYVTADLSG